MKSLLFSMFLFLFIIGHSQDFSKYDDSYGIFTVNFKINQNGKAEFMSIDIVQCKECSEEIINFFKSNAIKAFNKTAQNIENQYQTQGKEVINFKLPMIIKIEELKKDFEKNKKKKKN